MCTYCFFFSVGFAYYYYLFDRHANGNTFNQRETHPLHVIRRYFAAKGKQEAEERLTENK